MVKTLKLKELTHWRTSIHPESKNSVFAISAINPLIYKAMYYVINQTQKTCTIHSGGFPNVDKLLDNGDKIIIISTYSSTIKVPYQIEDRGIMEWEWEDFSYKASPVLASLFSTIYHND